MKISRAYKVELDPNNLQRTALLRHCGAARFVYNWGLNRKIEARKAGEKPLSAQKLDGALRSIMVEEFPWLGEVSSQCRQGALANLDRAYKNFFDRCKKGKKGKATGFPKFKSRKRGLGGFAVFGYTITRDAVRIARVGTVRLKEKGYLPLGGYGKDSETVRFFGARVTERAGRWYLSVQVEIETPESKPPVGAVGVDVGIKTLATCSDGLVFQNPKALDRNLKKLKRLSRGLSRKEKGSSNRKKAASKLARLHAKISDLRTHHLHHASHVITRKSSVIGIESLNVSGMMKNRNLAKAVADASFGELLRQIQYKAQWRGGQVVVADRWFASSKTCHTCGVVNVGLTLAQRRWVCECGVSHERDMNAANNLRTLAASRAVSACGEESSGESLAIRETGLSEAGSGQVKRKRKAVSPASAENGCIPTGTVENMQLRLF
jgi:putative transposase